MKKLSSRQLVISALFATLSIILTQFLSFYVPFLGSNSIRIGFGHIPLLLSGFLLGPLAGLTTGAVADFIGAIAFPTGGGYFPGFTLTAMLTGFLPGLLKTFRTTHPLRCLEVFAFTLITEVLSSILLNTFWLSILYGTKYTVLLSARIPVTLCLVVVYTAILYPLYRRLSSVSS